MSGSEVEQPKNVKPLIIPDENAGESIRFFEEAMAILDVSHGLREALEGWCDEHDT
jgi:hypothetical protein